MAIPVLRNSYQGGERIYSSPDIHLVDDFVSDSERHHLIWLAEPQLSASKVGGDKSAALSGGSSGSVSWIAHHHDEITQRLADRIAALVGLPLENAEAFQVIRYAEGGESRPHFDAYDLASERGRRCCGHGGQRLLTVLGYLSQVEAGGETVFPEQGISVAPLPGRLLISHNCFSGENRRDPNCLHQGKPVLRGRKWAFNLWFREARFQGAPSALKTAVSVVNSVVK